MPAKNASFSDKVREVVKSIPPGQTMSYGEVAKQAGNARAARAVARVMSQNYDPAVPCHRVIRADGQVGDYNRGGEVRKWEILESEGWRKM